jgi:hypothetical protein
MGRAVIAAAPFVVSILCGAHRAKKESTMFTFLLGLVMGAAGLWAYRTFWKPEDRWEDTWAAPASPIERPSSTEVHGRPSDPIPSSESAKQP